MLFPVTKRWAFFDHAAVAPLSEPARLAMMEWINDMAENGVVSDPRWVKRIAEVRKLAAQLLNASSEDVAFVKNTSEGIGIVAEGIRWNSGDNVVTSADEYPANLYPWMNLASRGVELRQIPSRDGRILIDDLAAAIDSRTRILTLSFVEYATGFRNDLDAAGALCRQHGIYFFVDAIQGLGVFPIDVRQTPIDFLAADGHKWLLGPEGAGLFYVRREVVDELHAVGVGWNSVVGARDFNRMKFDLKPHAGRWESGSYNVAGITALGASLEMMLDTGISNIQSRVLQLTDYVCSQAESLGLSVYSSREERQKSGIVSLDVGEADPKALVQACRQSGVVINQRANRLRISPHYYNTEAEIDRLVDVLRSELAKAT